MGSRVKLASIESVARSLQAVGRPQDLADVHELERHRAFRRLSPREKVLRLEQMAEVRSWVRSDKRTDRSASRPPSRDR